VETNRKSCSLWNCANTNNLNWAWNMGNWAMPFTQKPVGWSLHRFLASTGIWSWCILYNSRTRWDLHLNVWFNLTASNLQSIKYDRMASYRLKIAERTTNCLWLGSYDLKLDLGRGEGKDWEEWDVEQRDGREDRPHSDFWKSTPMSWKSHTSRNIAYVNCNMFTQEL